MGFASPKVRGVAFGKLRGLFLLSAGVLLYELLLMRVFSVMMWYHFASLAIALALLGLGAGGVVVGCVPGTGQGRAPGWWAAGFGVAVLVLLAFMAWVRADPAVARATLAPFHQPFYEPFSRSRGSGMAASFGLRLGALACVAGLPFFSAGVATAGLLVQAAPRVQAPYAATFLGSAVGCLALPLLLGRVSAPAALCAAALLGFLGARDLAAGPGLRRVSLVLAALALGVGAWAHVSGGAEVPFARGLYEPRFLAVRWNTMSRVAAFPLPAGELGRAFGLSRSYSGPTPDQVGLVVDDSGYTNLYDGRVSRATPEYFRSNLVALAYQLRPRPRALILGPGGGKDVWIALSFPGAQVRAVEINPQVVEMVQETFQGFTGRPYSDPRVDLSVGDGRRFAALDTETYDVVEASALFGRLPPAAGAFTLSEDLLHTVEAFQDYWRRLSPNGILSLSRFSYEQRALRLTALARALLDREGVSRPGAHVRVVSDRGLANVLVCKAPFTPADDARLAALARELSFSFVYPSPGGETALSRLLDAPTLNEALVGLPFDVSPPTDDRPFFYYTVRPWDFLRGHLPHRVGFDDRGAEILRAAFGILAVLTVTALLAPLVMVRVLPGAGTRSAATLSYAALVGLGYMALEIGTMKRLSLFLGHPVYAATATLFAFLLGGGAGSLVSGSVASTRTRLQWVLLSAAALGLLQALVVPRLLTAALPLPDALRWTVATGLLLPLAFTLGVPFPGAIALLGARSRELVPWAWAVNGAASVLGSLGSVLVAMNFGYTATLSVGAGLYGAALLVVRALPVEAV
ncbi:MAG: hypothetical protein HY900_12160 [Deltaproteobacteria bacterium]|nr:hypothetical protein [Deltaproteobacteria bacterium]